MSLERRTAPPKSVDRRLSTLGGVEGSEFAADEEVDVGSDAEGCETETASLVVVEDERRREAAAAALLVLLFLSSALEPFRSLSLSSCSSSSSSSDESESFRSMGWKIAGWEDERFS